ncbi:MAG: hypothetical protein ACOY0T_18475 [Myxococcota bacterium]
MKAERCLLLASVACACSGRYVQTAEVGGAGGQMGGAANYAGAPACNGGLEQRLSIVNVTLEEDIRYRARAYDNIARDEALAFAIGPDQKPSVAWLNNAGNTVHVSSLNADGSYRSKDVTLASSEVGGLAVRPDGFMLFTSGPDPGEPLQDPNNNNVVVNRAALLSRYRNQAFEYSIPLTGTSQVTSARTAMRRDCTPTPLTGRLAFSGNRYGAYFAVHGCSGHPSETFYGDKLAYVTDTGQAAPGGFSWNCNISEGLQLLPEPSIFTSLCLSEGTPAPGLNLVLEGMPSVLLSPEANTQGYVGAQFGGIVKLSDGSYVLAWLSRGTSEVDPRRAAKPYFDIAMMYLSPTFNVVTPKLWLSETPELAEYNLHVAPYGRDRVLLIWDSVAVTNMLGETGFGTYQGTFARVFDTTGTALGPAERLPAPPNGSDSISVYSNGDLGWAFVSDEARSYASPLMLDNQGIPQVPARRSLALARLVYCE